MQGDNDKTRLKLPTVLDLAAAGDLLATLRQRLAAEPRLCVDASEVESLTLPCIQVLLAGRRAFAGMAIELASPAFVSACDDLGLDNAELCNAAAEAGDPSVAPEPVAAVAVPPLQPGAARMTKRILTIDDSKTIRDMLMLTLADAGFEVLQAVDGQDGLDVLSKEQVDIVITDINMPRMDGYEVIRQMRSNPAYGAMPILVLTTESETDKKKIAREAGATGWLVKPFDPVRLVETINKVAA
jgi:two-component system, chemotaxis family, chemotaxis protein CheY